MIFNSIASPFLQNNDLMYFFTELSALLCAQSGHISGLLKKYFRSLLWSWRVPYIKKLMFCRSNFIILLRKKKEMLYCQFLAQSHIKECSTNIYLLVFNTIIQRYKRDMRDSLQLSCHLMLFMLFVVDFYLENPRWRL